jgi:hypothetical protein
MQDAGLSYSLTRKSTQVAKVSIHGKNLPCMYHWQRCSPVYCMLRLLGRTHISSRQLAAWTTDVDDLWVNLGLGAQVSDAVAARNSQH